MLVWEWEYPFRYQQSNSWEAYEEVQSKENLVSYESGIRSERFSTWSSYHSTDQDLWVSGPLSPVAACMEVDALSSGTVLSRRDSLQSTESNCRPAGNLPREVSIWKPVEGRCAVWWRRGCGSEWPVVMRPHWDPAWLEAEELTPGAGRASNTAGLSQDGGMFILHIQE